MSLPIGVPFGVLLGVPMRVPLGVSFRVPLGIPFWVPLGFPCRDSLRSTHLHSSVHIVHMDCRIHCCLSEECTLHIVHIEVCTMCRLSSTQRRLQEDGAWQRMRVTAAGNTGIRQMGAAFDKHTLPNTARPPHIPPTLILILCLISYALLGWVAGWLEAVTPILRSGGG